MNANDYITYHSGIQADIIGSTQIALALCETEINQSNFSDIYESLKSTSTLINKTDNGFLLSPVQPSLEFNSVFYLKANGTVCGVTKFQQVFTPELTKGSYSQDLLINVELKPTDLKSYLVTTKFLGKFKDNSIISDAPQSDQVYISKKCLFDYYAKSDNYVRYTNNLKQFEKSKDSVVLLDSSALYQSDWFYLFTRNYDINLIGWDKVWFTYYSTKRDQDIAIAMYSKSTRQLKILSLTKNNQINSNAYRYFSGTLDDEPWYVANHYVVFSETKYYDTLTNQTYQSPEPISINPFELQAKPKSLLRFNTRDLIGANSLKMPSRLIGPWAVFKYPNYDMWLSSFGSLMTGPDEDIHLINNRVFIKQGQAPSIVDDSQINCTWTYCIGDQVNLRTEEYYQSVHPNMLKEKYNQPVKIYMGNQNMSMNYDKYIFLSPNERGLKRNQVFDGLRHFPLRGFDIPNIIGGIGGIIIATDSDNNVIML